MSLTKDDVVRLMADAVRELRPDLEDVPIDASTPLWHGDDDTAEGPALDLDSLDLLEVLIIFEEDHGLLMPEELEDLGSGTATVGQLAELLLYQPVG
jgi:acyl carrier protein